MTLDRSFVERNRTETERLRSLIARLSDADLNRPVGEHWVVATALAHLAFWDRRVISILDASEREGKVVAPTLDIAVNDISLPLWRAIPPREAARLALASAEEVDRRLEACPPELLEQIGAANERYLLRANHRKLHLDELEQVLGS